MMALSVIRRNEGLVKPGEETPTTTLELSAMDSLPVLRCNARTLHVFKHGPQAARIIREALSKALVPYYPLAGTLLQPKPPSLQVQCSARGVWFVEASSHSTLGSLNFFQDYHSIPYHHLLPTLTPQTHHVEPLLQMQVTEFGCGGFVIGLIFCHSICDGLGAAQFLNAIGELARGLEKPSIEPVWRRDFFPSQEMAMAMAMPIEMAEAEYKLEHATIDIDMEQIKGVKREFEEGTGGSCSAFEIVAAACWASRTKAIELGPDSEVKLVFFANCRNLVEPPLAKGFYGNCFFPVSMTASCEWVRKASTVEVVKLIQEGKGNLGGEFGRYLKGEHLEKGEDPFAPPLSYATLFVSEWGRLGFNHVDYGWGPPVHVVPIQGSSVIPVAIVGSQPLPSRGIRLMTWCVQDPHRTPFLRHMRPLTLVNHL